MSNWVRYSSWRKKNRDTHRGEKMLHTSNILHWFWAQPRYRFDGNLTSHWRELEWKMTVSGAHYHRLFKFQSFFYVLVGQYHRRTWVLLKEWPKYIMTNLGLLTGSAGHCGPAETLYVCTCHTQKANSVMIFLLRGISSGRPSILESPWMEENIGENKIVCVFVVSRYH